MNEQIVTLTAENLSKHRAFCGLSGRYLVGYGQKTEWIKARIPEGLRYKLLQVNGHNVGFIEYIPGEFAWRGVDARGYLFIHCFWVIGRNRGHGYGQKLLQTCLEDAKNYYGVAVAVSKSHWLPTPNIFLKNNFELADKASPSFNLLVKRFSVDAPLPRFNHELQIPEDLSRGLTFIKTAQCPYAYVMDEGIQQLGKELNIPVRIVQIDSPTAAQTSPCVYGVMGLFYNGELVTYHPVGKKKLLELLEPLLQK